MSDAREQPEADMTLAYMKGWQDATDKFRAAMLSERAINAAFFAGNARVENGVVRMNTRAMLEAAVGEAMGRESVVE